MLDRSSIQIGLYFALLLMCWDPVSSASFKLISVKCQDHDETFLHFKTCELTDLKPGLKVLNIYVELHKKPLTNTLINVAFYRRSNGYQPYLPNITADVCVFFENRKKYPILQLAYSNFLKYSNVNHSCPYNHDIIVKDMVSDESLLKLFPIPLGDYLLKVKFYAYNDMKATIDIYVNRSD